MSNAHLHIQMWPRRDASFVVIIDHCDEIFAGSGVPQNFFAEKNFLPTKFLHVQYLCVRVEQDEFALWVIYGSF